MKPGVAIALLLLPLATILPAAQAAGSATVDVSIVKGAISQGANAFAPNPVHVMPGDTVRWTNNDSALHTVTSGTPSSPDEKFGSDESGSPVLIPPSKTFEHTFTQEGEYPYFCQLHPFMTGTVIVGDTRSPPYPIAVKTDKSFYTAEETITISGRVSNVTESQDVLIQIFNPDGAAFRFDQVSPSADGSFSYLLKISGPLGISGLYKVTAAYSGSAASASFYWQAPQFYIKVNAVSNDTLPLNMWLTVQTSRIGNGVTFLGTYTPASFALDAGKAYPVTMSDYLDSKFSHWENGSTDRTRTVTLSANTTLTAYYESGHSIRGFTPLTYAGSGQTPGLTIDAVSLAGKPLHMWTRIERMDAMYRVTAHDYFGLGAYVFDHWEDGSADRTRTLAVSDDSHVAAYYKTFP